MFAYITALIVIASVLTANAELIEADYTVSPDGPISSISHAIDLAQDGDTILVGNGVYKERIVIDKSISLIGIDKPIIDGQGKGTIVLIKAPKCTIKGFIVRGSGTSLTTEDSGIVLDSAPDSVISNNQLKDVLFGIYLKNSPRTIISDNKITGKDLPLPQRGDGIRLWYSSKAKILNNHIIKSRDLVMWWSGKAIIKGNKVEKGRYGLHYMYSNDNVFEDNIFTENSVGGFLMYSNGIKFYHNIFANNQSFATGYGIGFKDLDDVVAEENLFINNRIGLYLDNSPHLIDSWNEIVGNVIAFNDIGASLMPSIERNIFVSNSFIDNTEQIEVRGGGTLSGNKWYLSNSGNFWSDYVGYDDNSDGIGETPYKAENLFESLVDTYPNLRLFIFSPVSLAIELASNAFPLIKPVTKITDEYPLLAYHIPSRFRLAQRKFSVNLFIVSSLLVLFPLVFYYYLIKQTHR